MKLTYSIIHKASDDLQAQLISAAANQEILAVLVFSPDATDEQKDDLRLAMSLQGLDPRGGERAVSISARPAQICAVLESYAEIAEAMALEQVSLAPFFSRTVDRKGQARYNIH